MRKAKVPNPHPLQVETPKHEQSWRSFIPLSAVTSEVTSEASYCRANLERVRGYWPWNRFEKTREQTESFLSPNVFHPEPGGSCSLGMCLYQIWCREQPSPFLLRAGIPHILLMRTALKGFGAHIWKTSSPFLSQVVLEPAAKGARQGTELIGQAGSGKDSPERPAQLTSFSEGTQEVWSAPLGTEPALA